MPSFSPRSLALLETCDPRLQRICHEVVVYKDISIVCGQRSKFEQDEAHRTGNSQLKYPFSKHNTSPLSYAVDIAPWDAINKTINWHDTEAFYVMLGHVERVAAELGVPLRHGGNFDQDYEYDDGGFVDLCHIELVI